MACYHPDIMWEPTPLSYKELPGLSARLLKEHWKLYEGYLSRWDDVYHAVRGRRGGDKWEFGRLIAEESFLRNAVRLHELYFENLTPGGSGSAADFFGDDGTADHFVDWMRRAAEVSTGWVVLAVDLWRREPFVLSMKDHVTGFTVDAWPLLVLDCYEHAFARDYGVDKDAYIDAFFKNASWDIASRRAREAVVEVGS